VRAVRGARTSLECQTAITPGIARAGDSIPAKGLGKSMNSVYALIYIVAAAVVVTVAFLVVTALTP
jgi:hypothetical protein